METKQEYFRQGAALLAEGKWGGATQKFEGALAYDADDPNTLVGLATAIWNDGVSNGDSSRKIRAMQHADRVLKIDPEHSGAVRLVMHMTDRPDAIYRTKPIHPTSAGKAGGAQKKIVVRLAVMGFIFSIGISVAVFFMIGEEGPNREVVDPVASDMGEETIRFGSKGTGPGYFTDARSIGVDARGNLYVGEYRSGRVQVFTGTGEFLAEWRSPVEGTIQSMEVSREGIVHLVQGGEIVRLQGVTGELIGLVEYDQGPGFSDLSITSDGTITATWRGMRRSGNRLEGISDDVVKIAPDGEATILLSDGLRELTGGMTIPRIAVSGIGMIYVLDRKSEAVYVFNGQGEYRDRIGESGDEPGQLRAPTDLAITNQGEILVADIRGIHRFSPTGRHLETTGTDGVARGIVVEGESVWGVMGGSVVGRELADNR